MILLFLWLLRTLPHVLNQQINAGADAAFVQQRELFTSKTSQLKQDFFYTQLKLTLVMADELLQGAEGDAGWDIEASVVQSSDLVMFDVVIVSNGQRVAAWGEDNRNIRLTLNDSAFSITIFFSAVNMSFHTSAVIYRHVLVLVLPFLTHFSSSFKKKFF